MQQRGFVELLLSEKSCSSSRLLSTLERSCSSLGGFGQLLDTYSLKMFDTSQNALGQILGHEVAHGLLICHQRSEGMPSKLAHCSPKAQRQTYCELVEPPQPISLKWKVPGENVCPFLILLLVFALFLHMKLVFTDPMTKPRKWRWNLFCIMI